MGQKSLSVFSHIYPGTWKSINTHWERWIQQIPAHLGATICNPTTVRGGLRQKKTQVSWEHQGWFLTQPTKVRMTSGERTDFISFQQSYSGTRPASYVDEWDQWSTFLVPDSPREPSKTQTVGCQPQCFCRICKSNKFPGEAGVANWWERLWKSKPS